MATMIFSTPDRDECHRQLEVILASGAHPKAECRERDENGNYTIWDGPQRGDDEMSAAPATAEAALAALDDVQLARLADMLAARMKGG